MSQDYLSLLALLIAALLDWLIGDPPSWPHPVRLIGLVIEFCEAKARKLFNSSTGLRFAGFLIVLIVAGGFMLIALLLVAAAYRLSVASGFALELYIYYSTLAGGDLRHHVLRVKEALAKGKIGQARQATAMLVSRETGNLQEEELSRAALESLFENSADGLVAPLFFAVIGGPAAVVLYKAVNTLDSMIGYKNSRYIDLGCFAAKVDDLFNYVPARLTALLILLAGMYKKETGRVIRVIRRDRRNHESPNSAWPEAAAAAVLNVRFGGDDLYGGKVVRRPLINREGNAPLGSDLANGLKLYKFTALLAYCLSFVLIWLLKYREVGL